MKISHLIATSSLFALVSFSAAQADVIDLTFEGINATYPSGYAFINNFYNGGTSSDGTSGVNYGISFPSNAQAICLNSTTVTCSNTSRGGLGDPNSQKGGLFFLSGNNTFLDDAAGFTTGFSFNYSAVSVAGAVQVYSGLDGTGTLLANLALPVTSSSCSGYSAAFCPFVAAGITFAGTAESISFNGVANEIVFDDITFGSATPGPVTGVPEPVTLSLFGAGVAGMVAMRRRKKAANA
jgi:PEP-CTERM motif